MKPLLALLADEGGNSFTELALTAPMFVALILGTMEVSRTYSIKLGLEQAAQRTIEKVQRTDYLPSDNTTLQSDAASAAGVATSAVTVTNWLECNGVTNSDWNAACGDTETYARYVQISITKSFTPLFGTRYFHSVSSGGTVSMTGTAGVRVQ